MQARVLPVSGVAARQGQQTIQVLHAILLQIPMFLLPLPPLHPHHLPHHQHIAKAPSSQRRPQPGGSSSARHSPRQLTKRLPRPAWPASGKCSRQRPRCRQPRQDPGAHGEWLKSDENRFNVMTNHPLPGCITTADNLTSVGCTRLPRTKRLSGCPSSPLRRSRPARRRPFEERQQPGSCFGRSTSGSRAARGWWGTADGEPSTERRPATTSLSTTSPAASQQCAYHKLQPGRHRRVDSSFRIPASRNRCVYLVRFLTAVTTSEQPLSPFHALSFLQFTSCQFILQFCYARSYFVLETHPE